MGRIFAALMFCVAAAAAPDAAVNSDALALFDQIRSNLDTSPDLRTLAFATEEWNLCRVDYISVWFAPATPGSKPEFDGLDVQHYFFIPTVLPDLDRVADRIVRTANCRLHPAPRERWIEGESAHDVSWGRTVLEVLLKQAAASSGGIDFDCDYWKKSCAADIAAESLDSMTSARMCDNYGPDGCFDFTLNGRHLNVHFAVKDRLFGGQTFVFSRVRSRYDYVE